MRRSIITLLGAGGELVRFFGLAALCRAFLGNSGSPASQALYQFAAAPQLLFAGGFFFLWRDPIRYGVYRPLLAAGKALCVLTLASLTVRFLLFFRQDIYVAGDPAAMLAAMAAFLLWDAAAGIALVVSLREPPGSPEPSPADPGAESPEPVEID